MPQIRHILFPYDFSVHGDHIVPYVRAVAQRFSAHITVMSVLPPTFAAAPAPLGGYIGADRDASVRALQSRLDLAFIGELDDVTVNRLTEGGDPAIRIVQCAKEQHVDLIMMPTHGLGVLRAFLVGSTTARVLHDAACPIWTAAHEEAQTARPQPKNILCAIDDSTSAQPLALWARDFASTMGATVQLLHVVSPITDWTALESERRLQETSRQRAAEDLGSRLLASGLELPLRVAVGGIVDTVVEEARQQGSDLVIVGRGAITEPFGRLRTHAFGIIERSGCPVISVQACR